MTYAEFLQGLQEAEARTADETLPQDVRDRSAVTVSLFKQRMVSEGLTRQQLEALAA